MKVEINFQKRHLAYLAFTLAVLTAINLGVALNSGDPALMGHSWDEMECDGCIGEAGLEDGAVSSEKIASRAVTSAKMDSGAVTRDKIADDAINDSKIESISYSKIADAPGQQQVRGAAIYKMPAGCGGGIAKSTTCNTVKNALCEGGGYMGCNSCPGGYSPSPTTCSTSFFGYLAA